MPWKRHPFIRVTYFGMYLLFFIAGVFTFFYPAQAIVAALTPSLAWAWAGFLMLGGFFSMMAPLRNRWGGELIGLPLLSASHFIFGLSLIGFSQSAAATAVGIIFCGFGSGMIGRWADIKQKARIARGVGDGN